MPRHDRGDFLPDEVFERNEFSMHERLFVDIDFGKPYVRVAVGVSVSRKMLCRRDNARRNAPCGKSRTENARVFGIVSEGARSDDRGSAIGKEIDRRCKIHIDAERFYFARNIIRAVPRVDGVACSSDRHIARRDRRFAFDVADPTALLIGRDEQRYFKSRLRRAPLQRKNGTRNEAYIPRVPSEHFYAAEPARNPIIQKLIRLGARPAEHKYLRKAFRIAHAFDDRACERFCRIIAPKRDAFRKRFGARFALRKKPRRSGDRHINN